MRQSRSSAAVALAAGTTLAVALAGCSSGGGGGDDGGGGDAPTKLVVYGADPGNAEVWQGLLDDFGAENDVTVELISYPSADFIQNFTSAVNGGSQIDALLANGQDIRYFKSKDLLTDLTGVVDTADLVPAAHEPFTIDGKLYGAGTGAVNVTAWVYNATIFEEQGLTPPETVADVVEIAKQLEGTGIAPVSVPGGNIYLWPMWGMQTIQQATDNTPMDTTFATLESGDPAFDSEVYVEALKALAQLGAGNIFANGYQALDQDGANALFSEGKAAMFFGGTWDVSTIIQQAPDLDVRLLPFPNFVEGVESAAFGGVGMAAAGYAKADEGHRALVEKLVQYLSSAEACEVLMGANTSGIGLPAVTTVTPKGKSPLQQEIIDDSLPTTVTFLDWYWPKEVTAAFQQGIQAVAGGVETPEAVAAKIQAAFDSAKQGGWEFN